MNKEIKLDPTLQLGAEIIQSLFRDKKPRDFAQFNDWYASKKYLETGTFPSSAEVKEKYKEYGNN